MWEPVVETRDFPWDSSREESRKEAIGQNITEMTNWSFQTLSKPNRKKNTVEVLDSNNCFKCTKNKHFRKRNPTFNKYHWKTKRSRVDEGRERNQEVDKKKINSIFNCSTQGILTIQVRISNHNSSLFMRELYQEQSVENWIKVSHISLKQFNFWHL